MCNVVGATRIRDAQAEEAGAADIHVGQCRDSSGADKRECTVLGADTGKVGDCRVGGVDNEVLEIVLERQSIQSDVCRGAYIDARLRHIADRQVGDRYVARSWRSHDASCAIG